MMSDQPISQEWESAVQQLKPRLIEYDLHEWTLDTLKLIGGVDISFVKCSETDAVASLIVCDFPDLNVVYEATEPVQLTQPYIPGFLAFREEPHLAKLLNESPIKPDVVLVDGNGILHYKGFGLASHLGVNLDIPTVGVAKNLMVMDGLERDDVKSRAKTAFQNGDVQTPLIGVSGKTWGAAVRSTLANIDPIFVSIGHRMSLETSIQLVRLCSLHRVPEPIRQADLRSRDYVRKHYDV